MNKKSVKELINNLDQTLNEVVENNEKIIITRANQDDVVLISLREFNSLQETLYLISSSPNKVRLDQAVSDINMNINIIEKDIES